ncbi:hypothetical protein DKX38_010958 [Salix brachista]|uniref:Uncharacterized protein n=1 Tax=Salix brachista TaxID=2182728 RepID=A0A5N5LY47_9ROSI|nr:hypothetical protein DKX38_010958 [Salix brachista]
MTVSGLTGNPCCLRIPLHDPKTLSRRFSVFLNAEKPKDSAKLLGVKRSHLAGSVQRCNIKETYLVKCAMDASYGGDMTNDRPDASRQYELAPVMNSLVLAKWSQCLALHGLFEFVEVSTPFSVLVTSLFDFCCPKVIFPRIHVRDPYKRLGISREASEDEIQAARRFLVNQYAGHKPSVDAIESAHDKIIMQKFYDRKNPKIDFKKKVREMKQSRFMQFVTSRFQTPSTNVIIKTAIAFLVLGALTFLFPTEEGPTLQVAISLIATIYFIHDRLKSKLRAFLYGAGSFIFAWLLGTFLMVSVIPPLPLVKGPRSFEVITSLITYALLWVSSTYLK